MTEHYGFGCRVAAPMNETIERTTAALKEQGFGVLTTIDVQQTLKNKIGVDFQPYVILGACNPNLAHRALQAEKELGLLLPCNVIVYDNGDAQHRQHRRPRADDGRRGESCAGCRGRGSQSAVDAGGGGACCVSAMSLTIVNFNCQLLIVNC